MRRKYILWAVGLLVCGIIYALTLYKKSNTTDTIIIGSSLALNGINKELGQEVLEGANTYFKYTNENSDIDGKKINFIYYDDKYEPQNTLRNTKKLINEDHVFALFGFVGTPTTKEILPTIADIPLVAPYSGASFLRNAHNGNIVNFRSSYAQEIENIIHHLHRKNHIVKFAIFYQNDDYGIAGYNAVIKALKKRGLKLAGEGTYKRNTLSIKHALREIQQSQPEAIIIVGAYKPSARFVHSWRDTLKNNTIFAPISFVNANALIRELDGDGENIYFSHTVPSYDDKELKIANEYKTLLHRYYPNSKPSYASFESFLAAKIVVKALQNIGATITQDKFLESIKHIEKGVLGQIPISYKNSQLLNKVYMSTYHDGEFYPVKNMQ